MTDPSESDPALAVAGQGLCRRFGRRWAVAHVDLEVRRGECLLLAGANGSGKTTLLRLLAGLAKATRGRLEVMGQRVPTEWRRDVSLISHDSYLYSSLTALEMVRLWSRFLGRPDSPSRLEGLLEEVALERERHTRVADFSAGMRRRLSWLRIRLEEPELVLLDEPFASLDPAGQGMIEGWVRRLKDEGKTLVIASHRLEQAAPLCERAIVLRQGQIVWRGAPSELAARYGTIPGLAPEPEFTPPPATVGTVSKEGR